MPKQKRPLDWKHLTILIALRRNGPALARSLPGGGRNARHLERLRDAGFVRAENLGTERWPRYLYDYAPMADGFLRLCGKLEPHCVCGHAEEIHPVSLGCSARDCGCLIYAEEREAENADA